MKKIIAQGAEAILVKQDNLLLKKRIKKNYRHKNIDKLLRKTRTKKEGKLLCKAGLLINIPLIKNIDENKNEILMEFIDGKKLSEYLDSFKIKKALEICKEIGKSIAKLHDNNIIHSDLTTSNMILKDKVYFIDFGLGFESKRIEDKAVDLHLLKQAFESKHFLRWKKYFNSVLEGYKESKNFSDVSKQFEKVEMRGRYKRKENKEKNRKTL